MEYKAPVGAADPNDPFVDFNDVTGEPGSIPPAAGIEHPQREIVAVIVAAGLTPSAADLTQLDQAIDKKIKASKDGIVYEGVTFGAGVVDAEPVRLDTGAGEYVKAVADGTANNQAVGFADVTNSRVYAFGLSRPDLFSGLTPGVMYYLDGTTPGAITDTPPDDAVKLGIAVSATQMDVDVDRGRGAAGGAGELSIYQAGGATLVLDGDVAGDYEAELDQNIVVTAINCADVTKRYAFYLTFVQGAGGGFTVDLSGLPVEWSYGELPVFPIAAGAVAKMMIEKRGGDAAWKATWVGAEYDV